MVVGETGHQTGVLQLVKHLNNLLRAVAAQLLQQNTNTVLKYENPVKRKTEHKPISKQVRELMNLLQTTLSYNETSL